MILSQQDMKDPAMWSFSQHDPNSYPRSLEEEGHLLLSAITCLVGTVLFIFFYLVIIISTEFELTSLIISTIFFSFFLFIFISIFIRCILIMKHKKAKQNIHHKKRKH